MYQDGSCSEVNERQLRLDMVEIGRRMYERGYIAGTDGNLSVRLGDGRFLATPSGVAKGQLESTDLVVTDEQGELVAGSGRPSSELKVHLTAYALRPEIGAVVHAHPQAAVAFTLAGISLAPTFIPETVLTLGTIAASDYETPGTPSLADKMAEVLRCHDAITMARHGTITLGKDLLQAYHRLESLEHTAVTLYMARTLGGVDPLPNQEVERLFELAERIGISYPERTNPSCQAQVAVGNGSDRAALVEQLVRKVLERVAGVPGDDLSDPKRSQP